MAPEVAKKGPLPWARASRKELRALKGVFLDIDDTLSTAGKLTAEAYAALWQLKRAGLAVVPVTGRPAGWCDHIARFWPVDAVVGENGAFVFYMQGGVRRRLDTPGGPSDPAVRRMKLDRLGAKIRERFEAARWASDQAYREFDLAIDVCEDVPPWPRERVEALLELCRAEGAHAKLSSIHVNAWFGEYDKRKGLEAWLGAGTPGWKGKRLKLDELLFIGDSPNDEPLFAAFRRSVGVANLARYLDRVEHPPTWITRGESGKGFIEMTRRVVQAHE